MSQNDQINARLADIYQTLSKIQEIGVMYSPDIDNNIKTVFLIWYEMKLNSIKEELHERTSIVIG